MAKTKHVKIEVLVHESDATLPRLIIRHCDYCDIWISESIGASCEDDCGFGMLCHVHKIFPSGIAIQLSVAEEVA